MSRGTPVVIDLEADDFAVPVINISSDDEAPVDRTKTTNTVPVLNDPSSDRARKEHKDQGPRRKDAPRPAGGRSRLSSNNKTQSRSPPRQKSSPRRQSRQRTSHVEANGPESLRVSKASTSDRLEDHIQAVAQERASESRDGRRCTGCVGVDEVCNGKKPCDRCAGLGFTCMYTDGPITASKHQTVSPLPETCKKNNDDHATEIEPNLGDEFITIRFLDMNPDCGNLEKHKDDRATKVEPTPASGVLYMHTPRIDASTVRARDLSSDEITELESMPRGAWLPRSVHEMRELIKVHQDNLNAHREYLLQAQLIQARIRAQQRPTMPDQHAKVNPFKKLLQVKTADEQENSPLRSTKLQIKVHGTHRGSRKNNYQTVLFPARPLPVDPEAPILPKYRSIGRLGTSFLSKNVHTLLSLPYFPEEEGPDETAGDAREAELKERYRNNDIGMLENPFRELRLQRRCLERAWYWSDEFTHLLQELQLTPEGLYVWLLTKWGISKDEYRCKVCNLRSNIPPTRNSLSRRIPESRGTDDEYSRYEWLRQAFSEITSIPIWHLVDLVGSTAMYGVTSKAMQQAENDTGSSLCSICFVHSCQVHGSYIDGDEQANDQGPYINDPEVENNTRVTTVMEKNGNRTEHVCGLFCCGLEQFSTRDTQIIGLDDGGRLSGKHNGAVEIVQQLADFQGTVPCENECFLDLRNRQNAATHSERQKILTQQLARSMAKLYGNNLRLPCMVAKISRVSCSEALRQVLRAHREPSHPRSMTLPQNDEELAAAGKRRTANRYAGYNVDNSADIDKRGPILPCAHSGPCLKEHGCRCAKENVHCESFCGCDASGDAKCRRRFKGCNCKGPCFKDARCECWIYNRECDPWLCKTCGVLEVLDPPNKYRPEIRIGRCQNNKIQLDLPAKTIKAPSEVQGWGLFAGEDLDKHAFIGEYKGEIISAGSMEESDRRGVVYHNHGLEYLFMINTHQEMDGSTFGNKTRFMNNSQLDTHINVLAQKLIANGVPRIMFYTARPVKAGEELLYNYNYPQDITKHFWEKGDRVQAGKNGLIMPVSKPRLPSARVTREALANVDDEQQPARKKVPTEVVHGTAKVTTSQRKRKRVEDDEREEGEGNEVVDDEGEIGGDDPDDESASESAEQLVREFQKPARRLLSAREDSSDDEYEEGDEHSAEESDLEPDLESEIGGTESDEEIQPRQRRTKGPGLDTRFGGQAQRKAAATRRERAARGGRY